MKTFAVKRVKNADELVTLLPFFFDGLQVLNRLVKGDRQVKRETFCRVLFDTVAQGDTRGHVAVYREPLTDENLGFSISYASPDPYHEPTVVVYAAHASKTVPGLTRFALAHIEKWARGNGFKELQAFSPRINGKGLALFEKRFGFSRWLLHFYKKI